MWLLDWDELGAFLGEWHRPPVVMELCVDMESELQNPIVWEGFTFFGVSSVSLDSHCG